MGFALEKRLILAAALVAAASPWIASAHATPVSYAPDISTSFTETPKDISVTFSEHVDRSASQIKVKGPLGDAGGATSVSDDNMSLSTTIADQGAGTYLVTWSVISSDDGHFTRGTFPLSVDVPVSSVSSNTEIVLITTTPEALASTIELFGHGLIWAVLLLFMFAIRPVLGTFESDRPLIRRGYRTLALSAVALALLGGAAQILIKSSQLAELDGGTLMHALSVYAGTTAGFATMARMCVVTAVGVLVALTSRRIVQSARVTFSEIALIMLMLVFAYFRAKISHATANPFYPDFSIAVNLLHLIEKDIWAGIALILALFASFRRLNTLLFAIIPRAFQMLAIDLALVSVTASYIVWLHLKTFSNLFTTSWGTAFLQLLIAAVFLVGMRLYHTLARTRTPKRFARHLSFTLGLELAFALLVLYFSSVVIITSPPLSQPNTAVFSARDHGISITLQKMPFDDSSALVTVSNVDDAVPNVSIQDSASSDDPFSVELTERFSGGYSFPLSLLSGSAVFKVRITEPQTDGYDAHAEFTVQPGTFDSHSSQEAHRSFDLFTIIMICIALIAALFAAWLYRASGVRAQREERSNSYAGIIATSTCILFLIIGSSITTVFARSTLANPFRAECEDDGNMWHLMQPMRAGSPTAQNAAEGCMWGMGNYQYMFADQREYEYFKTFPKAEVVLAGLDRVVAGTPTAFTFKITEPDGTPAKLFVDMEKLLHVVIVSKDESVFAHIHPDDQEPLSVADIKNSTFTLNYTFPKAGTYLISADFAHGITLESKQFTVEVAGTPKQSASAVQYPQTGTFDGYDVSIDYALPLSGEVTTLRYTIKKNGRVVTDLVPYLSAAMHVSVVKNDLSEFIHVHGEYHAPGTPTPPLRVKNGQVVHSMAAMMTPATFSSPIEAHVIFPTAGVYTVWGQFKVGNEVIPTAFTVRVEE